MAKPTVIDAYNDKSPEHFRAVLKHLCEVIRAAAPDAEESITYQIPTFKVNGKAIGGFGFFKNHCTYFPFSGGLLTGFETELAGYDQTKSGVHFTPDKPIPDDLVKKMIDAKLAFNMGKK